MIEGRTSPRTGDERHLHGYCEECLVDVQRGTGVNRMERMQAGLLRVQY